MSVTRWIKSAIARVGAHHPTLGAYLATSVRTGSFCAYVPDARLGISWEM